MLLQVPTYLPLNVASFSVQEIVFCFIKVRYRDRDQSQNVQGDQDPKRVQVQLGVAERVRIVRVVELNKAVLRKHPNVSLIYKLTN